MSTYSYSPPSNSSPNKLPQNTKGTKYNIITVFNSQIQVDEISIPQSNDSTTQRLEDVFGIQYPALRINNYIFSVEEIDSLSIDCTDFLPSITFTCTFMHPTFISREMPKDGDLISVAIRNKSDILKMIRCDFVITKVVSIDNYTLNPSSPSKMTFFGELFIPGLKSQSIDLATVGTSMEAAMDAAKQYGLGFATNEDNTIDKQIWYKSNSTGDAYLQELSQRAYRDDKSFYNVWVDVYYNLNFINLNKQLISAEDEVDIAAILHNVDSTWNQELKSDQQDTALIPKVFSNYTQYRTTSFYIESWKPINRSSTITFQIGTQMACGMFEHNVNLYRDASSQKYWSLLIEPSYDKDKTNNHILLRGRAQYDPSINGNELARVNYDYRNLYVKYPWMGIQYTISNPDDDPSQWDGNHHKNYLKARVQNLVNNKELDKLNLEISVRGINTNILIGDKLPVALIRKDPIDNQLINKEAQSLDMLDLFYSGWFIVKGYTINYVNENSDGILSDFTQDFVLTRREWPAPTAVVSVNTPQGGTGAKPVP